MSSDTLATLRGEDTTHTRTPHVEFGVVIRMNERNVPFSGHLLREAGHAVRV